MASVRRADARQVVRLRHHPSASPEAICWCSPGCLILAWLGPGHVSMETLRTVTKLIRITTRIFLQIKGAHLNFRESLGDMKGPARSVSLLLSDRQCVYSLQPFLLTGCLCLADVDKCLGLLYFHRSLKAVVEVAWRCLSLKCKVPGGNSAANLWTRLQVYFCSVWYGENKSQNH